MGTLLRKAAQTNPSRARSTARVGPFTRLDRIWNLLFASLLLDPAVALLGLGRLHPELALSGAIAVAVALLPFLAQESLYRGIAALRAIHIKQLERKTLILPLLVGALVGLVILLKLMMLSGLSGAWGLALLILITGATLHGTAKAFKTATTHAHLLQTDLWSRVTQWESQLVALSLIPLVLARSIGVAGALAATENGTWGLFVVLFATSAIFLAILRPNRRLFVGFCKKCKQPVPIVFIDIGSCIQCDNQLRIAMHTRTTAPSTERKNRK